MRELYKLFNTLCKGRHYTQLLVTTFVQSRREVSAMLSIVTEAGIGKQGTAKGHFITS